MYPPFLAIALAAYLVGILLAILITVYRSTSARGWASVAFTAGWLAHLAAVIHRGVHSGHFPLTSVAEYLLVLGLAVMALHLLIWFRFKVYATGLVLPPLTAAAAGAALGMLRTAGVVEAPQHRGLFLAHTTVSTLGMATLIVALAMSLIYVMQDRALKMRKTLNLLDRLPSLERCDRIGLKALTIGFLLFTVGIVTGIFFNLAMYDRLWQLGLKQSFPLLAWAIFAVVLAARLKLGFRGRKSAYWTITGVTLGLLTIFGMTI